MLYCIRVSVVRQDGCPFIQSWCGLENGVPQKAGSVVYAQLAEPHLPSCRRPAGAWLLMEYTSDEIQSESKHHKIRRRVHGLFRDHHVGIVPFRLLPLPPNIPEPFCSTKSGKISFGITKPTRIQAINL